MCINRIPTTHGSDWRDLPNKSIIAEEGKVALKLNYCYKRPDGSKGVCSCFMVERWKGCYCDSDDRQRNTLIPWSATHAANRNTSIKHKFYGRAPWDGYFKTMSKVQTLKNPLSEYSGSGPNLSLRVLWLRTKSLSQSTLAQAQNPLPEYSGLHPNLSPRVLCSGQKNPPRVLWLRPKIPSQSTLA